MKASKLELAGWSVGTASEFLALSPSESMLIDIKLSLACAVLERRLNQGKSQEELALLISSSQSEVAKIEAADSAVPIELLVKCLVILGASRLRIGDVIGMEEG